MAFVQATFSALSTDGYVARAEGVYPPGANFSRDTTSAALDATRTFDGEFYYVRCPLLAFDTSSLPDDAVVVSWKLVVFPTFVVNENARSLTGEAYAWDGTSTSDWTATASSGLFSTALSSFTAGVSKEIEMSSPASLNTSGLTKIRLHISGSTPTGRNRINLAAYESTSPEAKLLVTYTGPPVARSFSQDDGFGSTATVPLPDPAPGSEDLLVVGLGVRADSSLAITPPEGFSLWPGGRQNGSGVVGAVYWKRATGTEAEDSPSGYPFGLDTEVSWNAGLACYSGANVAVPSAAASSQANSASTSVAAASVSPAVDYTKLLFFGVQPGTATYTPPSGMTERID